MRGASTRCDHTETASPHTASMDRVFPHALKPLVEVDPTMADLIVAEKERQWCVPPASGSIQIHMPSKAASGGHRCTATTDSDTCRCRAAVRTPPINAFVRYRDRSQMPPPRWAAARTIERTYTTFFKHCRVHVACLRHRSPTPNVPACGGTPGRVGGTTRFGSGRAANARRGAGPHASVQTHTRDDGAVRPAGAGGTGGGSDGPRLRFWGLTVRAVGYRIAVRVVYVCTARCVRRDVRPHRAPGCGRRAASADVPLGLPCAPSGTHDGCGSTDTLTLESCSMTAGLPGHSLPPATCDGDLRCPSRVLRSGSLSQFTEWFMRTSLPWSAFARGGGAVLKHCSQVWMDIRTGRTLDTSPPRYPYATGEAGPSVRLLVA